LREGFDLTDGTASRRSAVDRDQEAFLRRAAQGRGGAVRHRPGIVNLLSNMTKGFSMDHGS